ncbi:signal recognition particle subunit SRP19/SEC65 family protein [Caldivirga sp. UBA161]|uniref:signal recognition particle subunit SRP19/SEC65 family protein n=1 Tax=Caldivirga sp. UBA161 TaxID=1915569 RepID=UPI0025BFE745|nr:signal recognition particle subunit SRP19/SEC65 family protein [Caldivirga sp. UBA161]
MGRKDYWVVWRINIDSTVSRSNGRVAPRQLAVGKPTLDELIKAASMLGLKYEAHPEKKHPRHWFEEDYSGCIYVYKVEGYSRRSLIKKLAQIVKNSRRGG